MSVTIPVRELPDLQPRTYTSLHFEYAEYFKEQLDRWATTPNYWQLQKWQRDLDFIAAHSELHEQAWWVKFPEPLASRGVTDAEQAVECGTACCIAGWHTLLQGLVIMREEFGDMRVQSSLDPSTWTENGLGTVQAYACDDLGLFPFASSPHPFDGDQSIDQLYGWELALRQRAVDAGVINARFIKSEETADV